jgi:hypothetical protein
MTMSDFSHPPSLQELARYAGNLFARMHEAQHVPFMQVKINGDPARPNNCHENANLWIEENPTYSCVRGWLCVDGGHLSNTVDFLAHSVVAHPSGTMHDVTPVHSCEPRPFLPARISEDDFAYVVEVLVRLSGVGTLVHHKSQ